MSVRWPGAPRVLQQPFRRLFRPIRRPVPEGAAIVTAYTDGQVTLRSNRSKIGYHEAADLSGFQGVAEGDLVVHGLDILRGSVGVSDAAGAISAVCIVCQPGPHIDPRFAAHAIRVQAASGYTKALARGIREGGADFRRWATLAELPLPVPPMEYQRAVIDFLDRETAKIDTLIEEQQRLIEMLLERRQATITWAIPDGGQRHPRVALRFLSTVPIENGVDEQSDAGNSPDWPRFIRTTDVKTLTQLDHAKRVTVPPERALEAPVEFNDLLLTRAGASVGKSYIHLTDDPSCYAGYMVRVRPDRRRVEPMYLAYWTQTRDFTDQIATGLVKSTIENFSASKYRGMQVPVPSLDEQRRIAHHLDEQTAKVDILIAETERFIELSRERRAALITAAVTGQIDVRDRAAEVA